jgi:hypothetical protein
MGIELEKGTLLYRGVDCPPEQLKDPLRTNQGEGILWTTQDSQSAQTYIADWGASSNLRIPSNMEDIPRPDDAIVTALLEACGATVTINQREWPLAKYKPKDYPHHLSVNGTYGRATSWSIRPETGWKEIINLLKKLGYPAEPGKALWIKTQFNGRDRWNPVAANARHKGTLVIFETTEKLTLEDKTEEGDGLLEPAYHQAAKWAASSKADGLLLEDFCQSETHGNVSHLAAGILKSGLNKLKVTATLPAQHHRWAGQPSAGASREETQWRKQQKP